MNLFGKHTPLMQWEKIQCKPKKLSPLYRSAIPGGWLIRTEEGTLSFVPDPEHRWDGDSFDD